MKKLSFALAMLTIVSLALTGCAAPQAQAPQTIKIGLITQLTGDMAVVGQTVRNGAEMAVKEINAEGGVEVNLKKYKIELVVADSEGQEAKAVAAALKLITQDNVLAIVQHERSQTAVPVALIAESTKTVLIGGIAAPEFTMDSMTKQPRKYVFRSTFSSDFQGPALAQFTLTQLGAKKAAVLYDSESLYNRSLAESFKATFVGGISAGATALFTGLDNAPLPIGVFGGEGIGEGAIQDFSGEVVAFESYKTGDKDFAAQLNRIKAANPDVLFLPNYLTDVPTQVKQAKSLGIAATIVGPDTMAQADMLKACGAACDGAYATTDFRPEIPNKLADKFIQDYAAAYGAAPEWPAASAYDSIKILAMALERGAKVDREALRDGMTRVSYDGVSGNISFRAGSGDPVKAANIMQIKGGQFVWVANVQP